MRQADFIQDYDQFFPLMSVFRFGSDFAANNVGVAASFSGNDSPEINRLHATTGPETFPVDQVQSIADELQFPNDATGFGTGGFAQQGIQAGIALEGQHSRFSEFVKTWSVGTLAVVLIAVGVIYLGLTAYVKASGGGSVVSAVTGE